MNSEMQLNTNDLIVNDIQTLDSQLDIPEARAVLVVVVGTTMAELAVLQQAQFEGAEGLVPWRILVVDSVPYAELAKRLVQSSYPEQMVDRAIPRAHYFHLQSPFEANFDFNNPLNQAWLDTLFEPSLQRLARRPDGPGCAGTPALGRSRVEGNEVDLREFFERHLQTLTQVRTQTLGLRPGVKVFVISTYRGGTGTGATTPIGAVLRQVVDNGSTIHLHTMMPCIYGGDPRSYANAYAMLRENQQFHCYGAGVPMKGGQRLDAPFDSATYTFVSNGAQTLGHTDALMQETGILRAYLRARTQATIDAREVDLTDVKPYDAEDRPMHIQTETALSIRTVQPGTLNYLVTEWVRVELEAATQRFETWCQSETLTPEEDSRVEAAVQNTVQGLSLTLNDLLPRLEGTPTSSNRLRSFFENAIGMIGGMEAAAIKQGMPGLLQQVRDAFLKFERNWDDRGRQLAQTLPKEIADAVITQFAAAPHLALSVLSRVREHLVALAKTATQEAEAEQKRRDAAGGQLGNALNAVQQAGEGLLGFIKKNEVVRDAAHQACGIALQAALARAQQQCREVLAKALSGEMTAIDPSGGSVTVASVAASLKELKIRRLAEIRHHQEQRQETLRQRLDNLSHKIEKRSPIFQRSLLYDGLTRTELDAEAATIRSEIPDAPPIVEFLEGRLGMEETLKALLPLLPSYTLSGRRLTQILADEPEKRQLVVHLLRSLKEFTPLNREVLENQELRNRRDTLSIFELPGGQEGAVAQLLVREGIVTNLNQVVDSGDDEIRVYLLRAGLPYAAIRPLAKYRERYETHLKAAGAITPHTVSGAENFPHLEPSRVNLRYHTEGLLYVAKVVLPACVATGALGGFTLNYQQDRGQGYPEPKAETFNDFDTMVGWLAKRVEIRKALEADLKAHLEANSEAGVEALLEAWENATDPEQGHLTRQLYELQVNPWERG